MYNHSAFKKTLWFLAFSYSLLAFYGCSPKIKIGLWAKSHQEAALALGAWVAENPGDATTLLNIDCNNRHQFKKKITDALTNVPVEEPTQQAYDVRQHNYHYGNAPSRNSEDGFANWCGKYPRAAKKLRGHAKALCKTGLGLLNGSIQVYK
jgi:hypothetical protein